MTTTRELFTAPNLVSLLRLLLAPLALVFAIVDQPTVFLAIIALSICTDLADGFLARMLNQITALGSKLDSWGDFCVYSTMAVSALILWPQTVYAFALPCLTIVLSFTLPTLVGILKYRALTSYHTWSVKLAVAATIISYFLLFTGTIEWPFFLAAALCAAAALEETAITVLLPENTADVRSLFAALALRRKQGL